MSLITGLTIKEGAITLGIIGSLIGVGVNYQSTASTAKHAEETIKEVKVEVKENQKINVEQTVAITEAVTTLKYLSKNMEKLLDK